MNVQPAIERVIKLRGNGGCLAIRLSQDRMPMCRRYDGPFNPIRDGYRLTCSW